LGPVAPVSTLRVVIVSPRNSASTAGTCTAMLPGVWPGTRMIRGEPGASSTWPCSTGRSWPAGLLRSPPSRAEYTRKRPSGPAFSGAAERSQRSSATLLRVVAEEFGLDRLLAAIARPAAA
jgi:hypothetical protein